MSQTRRIAIRDVPGEVRVTWGDTTLAQSRAALCLEEEGYPPVFYLPPSDVDMAWLTASDKRSHCPYKGDASYFTLVTDETTVADIAWCYRQPIASVARIAEYIAFYRDKCDVAQGP